MASGIPTRRTTRTRNAPTTTDENAPHASRMSTKASSAGLSNRGTTGVGLGEKSNGLAEKATASTSDFGGASVAAGKAGSNALGTRKRLAEVTNKNSAPSGTAGASKATGKQKESATTTTASSKTSTTSTTIPRVGRRTRTSVAAEEAAKAIAAEEAAASAVQSKRPTASNARVAKPSTVTTTTAVARHRTANATASASTTVSRKVVVNTAPSKNSVIAPEEEEVAKYEDEENAGIEPAPKRVRTSSPLKESLVIQPQPQSDEEFAAVAPSVENSSVVEEEVAPVEGPAKDEGWVDLDAEDENDPLMVSEYVNDIFEYMMRLEVTTLPNPNYMDKQTELQWKMRGILVDWLIEVHGKFRLLPETLFLAINLIDRFLSQRVCSLIKLQLVGTTALFVASKYEEVICPSVQNFLYMADGGYSDEEILKAERYLLQIIDYNLSYPNPIHFLRRISKADDYDIQTRTVAKYLMEIQCVDHTLLNLAPSLLAAAGIWLARLVLERGEWNPNLVHYSSYSEEEILPGAQCMVSYILRPLSKQHECFNKKYASKKYMKASTYVREWAVGKWGEGGSSGDELVNFLREEREAMAGF